MARSRNIKPGFFKNELLAEMPPETRLLFMGLWCLADREGRFEDRPKKIKMELFPCDDFSIEESLSILTVGGFLIRYEVDGNKYAQVVNFTKHQMPHHKEVASEIPAPPGFKQITKHAYDVTPQDRLAVFKRDGDKCLKCGSVEDLSLDHITPLASGGDNSINNLQTLCKRCNSSKGNSTKDHRLFVIDATLEQRKHNDGASCPSDSLIPDSLIPDSLLLIPDSGFLVTDSLIPDKEIQFEAPPAEDAPEHAAKAEKVKPAKIAKQAAPSADTWAAYESAYLARYGAKPVRNATVNGQLANLVNRLGADESPAVAAWYVGHRNQFYVSCGHSVGMLLRDCEKLRTEWATGRQATQTQAIQGDRTQTNLNAFSGLLSEAKQKEFNHAQH